MIKLIDKVRLKYSVSCVYKACVFTKYCFYTAQEIVAGVIFGVCDKMGQLKTCELSKSNVKYAFVLFLVFNYNCNAQIVTEISEIQDVYIDQSIPSLNFGSAVEVKSKPYSPGWSQRFLLKADLSGLPNNIDIIEAKIKLTVTNYLWVNSNIGAYRINQEWDENTTTWSNFSNDYNDSPTAQKNLIYPHHSQGDAVYWDVTSDVQGMQFGIIENHGWFFRDINLGSNTQAYWNFASSENVYPDQRPVLQIKYSQFTPLPVELVSFSGIAHRYGIDLVWETSSEYNNDFFNIYKSNNGVNWNLLHTENGAGHSTELISYAYTDVNPVEGNNYYKLVQVDYDGSEEEHIINVNYSDPDRKQIMVTPNPSSGGFQVILNNKEIQGNAYLNVSDTRGNLIIRKAIDVKNGYNLYAISDQLSSGLYYISASDGITSTKTAKLIIQ